MSSIATLPRKEPWDESGFLSTPKPVRIEAERNCQEPHAGLKQMTSLSGPTRTQIRENRNSRIGKGLRFRCLRPRQ